MTNVKIAGQIGQIALITYILSLIKIEFFCTTAERGDLMDTSFSPGEHHTAFEVLTAVVVIAPTQKSAFA
jgi:hypothetical protein